MHLSTRTLGSTGIGSTAETEHNPLHQWPNITGQENKTLLELKAADTFESASRLQGEISAHHRAPVGIVRAIFGRAHFMAIMRGDSEQKAQTH